MLRSNQHYLNALLEYTEGKIPHAEKPICPHDNWHRDMEIVQSFDELFTAMGQCFNLDTYPNKYIICGAEKMLNASAHIGMPVMYRHFSFAQSFLSQKYNYSKGLTGLPYELVINSNPCISVNMVGNPTYLLALVMSHAGQGHNSFFKGNYMFKNHTDADSIIDYLKYARAYIDKCYKHIGDEPVRKFITACHALQSHGVERGGVNNDISSRLEYETDRLAQLTKTGPQTEELNFNDGGYQNIMYVLEMISPAAQTCELVNGSPWMKEVIRIVRNIGQYFYPQRYTQVMNEGWASFWHHAMTTLAHHYGYITDDQYANIIRSHTQVLTQLPYNHKHFNGFNPYRLGFDMFRDIMFMGRGPKDLEEQKLYDACKYEETFGKSSFPSNGKSVPYLKGDWLGLMHYAMENYADHSFVENFLSLNITREHNMFSLNSNVEDQMSVVTGTAMHLKEMRQALSAMYDPSYISPIISAVGFDPYGDRTLYLEHYSTKGKPLNSEHMDKVMKHIHTILRGPQCMPTSEKFKHFNAALTSFDTRNIADPKAMQKWPKS